MISAGLKEEANIDTRVDVQVEHFEANGRATSLLASQAKRGNQGKSAQSPAFAIVSEYRGYADEVHCNFTSEKSIQYHSAQPLMAFSAVTAA